MPLKAVPDLVEEIDLDASGRDIDREYLTFVLSEWDAQALEEALLIRDAVGAEVVAVGLAEDPDIDQFLYTALAKGADAAVRLVDPDAPGAGRVADRARRLAAYLADQPADLVLSGVQAVDDPDGQVVPTLAALLDLPHVSVAVGVEVEGSTAVVRQEFAGGRSHDLDVALPCVIGVQTARATPRYAPISRVKQAMQSGALRDVTVSAAPGGAVATVRAMSRPEATGRAQMLTGSADEVADQIVALLRERGLVKGVQ